MTACLNLTGNTVTGTYTPATNGIATNATSPAVRRMPGYTGNNLNQMETFIEGLNPGTAAGLIAVPTGPNATNTSPAGSACVTP